MGAASDLFCVIGPECLRGWQVRQAAAIPTDDRVWMGQGEAGEAVGQRRR